ncbi:MAG: L,D-transpeptidase family protein [Acidimicrobiales bacterium]
MVKSRGQRKHGSSSGLMRAPVLAAIVVVLAAAAAAGALVAAGRSPVGAYGSSGPPTTQATHVAAVHHASPPKPLEVTSVSPKPGAAGMGFRSDVVVSFNEPLRSTSPLPRLLGAPPGAWTRTSPRTVAFHPAGNFVPYAKVAVVLPAATESAAGARLGVTKVYRFSIAGPSTLRLQQLLAELGYLPLAFVPQSGQAAAGSATAGAATVSSPATASSGLPVGPPGPSGTAAASVPPAPPTRVFEPTEARDIPLFALHGAFNWRFAHIPGSLAALWQQGVPNLITTGAVMAFESDHGLVTDGVAGPKVWDTLLQAVAGRDLDRNGYDYVYVTTSIPEYVTLWRNGAITFKTFANTGIAQAPTQLGTWPVYARYVTTTMSGTNPDGSHYSDPGIPWTSYFHGGDALHGFLRSQYGFPQSLGCVEMTFQAAGELYPFTPLGTLVTVL